MIMFACKKIKQEELIRCSFGLNKTEYNVLMYLLKRDGMFTVSGIAKEMGLERTTVQKAIKGILNKRLVKRMQKNLSRGGYMFFYKVENKEYIKNEMKRIVSEWYTAVMERIDEL